MPKLLLAEIFLGRKEAINLIGAAHKEAIIPLMRLKGATIGVGTSISEGIIFHNCRNLEKLKIGNNCHIGKNVFIDLREEIEIKNNVVVAMNVTLLTHIDMTNSALSSEYPAAAAPIVIYDDVYIGAGATVLMGVEVGEKSFIGASALVNKDCKAKCMYCGVPARKVKQLNVN